MIIFKQASSLSKYLLQKDKNIGFVPTMGALHDGHLSLINESKSANGLTVCSIFVNPTQFNNAEDFKHYPITIEKDIQLLEVRGCDILFLPSSTEIYPPGYVAPRYDLGNIETVLEGAHRPGHFQGVCQVVDRLLQIVQPSRLYLGQKDFQQCIVIKKLLEITHRNTIELVVSPTVREHDGLAMSSRNLRLSPESRKNSPEIFSALSKVKDLIGQRPLDQLEKEAAQALAAKGFNVDYVSIVRTSDLQPPADTKEKLVVLAAASIGGIRLIDNLLLN